MLCDHSRWSAHILIMFVFQYQPDGTSQPAKLFNPGIISCSLNNPKLHKSPIIFKMELKHPISFLAEKQKMSGQCSKNNFYLAAAL